MFRPALALLLVGALTLGVACSDAEDAVDDLGSELETTATALAATPREGTGTPAARGTPQQGSESEICGAIDDLADSLTDLTTISSIEDLQNRLGDVGQDIEDLGDAVRNSDAPEMQQLDEDYEHFKATIDGLDDQTSVGNALSAVARSGRELLSSFIEARNAFDCP